MKRKIIALLAGAALLCGIAGCENTEGNVSAPESSTNSENSTSNVEQSSTAEPESSETTRTGKFDWDAAMNDFYINGIKMEYPFSESSLGEDFTFDVDSAFYSDVGDYLKINVDHRNCTGLWLFEAEYKNITNETYNKDCIVSAISYMFKPSIQGITEKTSMENVYALWGEPNEIEGKTGETNYDTAVYYGNIEGQKIYLWYDNTTNEVLLMSIDFVDMKG